MANWSIPPSNLFVDEIHHLKQMEELGNELNKIRFPEAEDHNDQESINRAILNMESIVDSKVSKLAVNDRLRKFVEDYKSLSAKLITDNADSRRHNGN